MSDRKVEIVNQMNCIVGFNCDNPIFRATWERKGAKKKIPYDVVEASMYQPGVEYLFSQGILTFTNKQDAIDLGLAAAEGEEPELLDMVKILTDEERESYFKMNLEDFKNAFNELSKEQRQALCDYAVDNELNVPFNKNKFIKTTTGFDILKAISLKQQDEDTEE